MTKNEIGYQMIPLIYDIKCELDKETMQSMAWLSYPYLMPTVFMKMSIFSAVSGKPMHLYMASSNRTRPCFSSVEVQVDLAVEMPKYLKLDIVSSTG